MAVDLALAKQHLRVDTSEEDGVIAQYINAASRWVEGYTGKLLTRREVTEEICSFSPYLELQSGPVPSDITIDYIDADGEAAQVLDAKIVSSRAYPNDVWPTIDDHTPITLTYTAGYETPPSDLDSAVLLLVAEYYDNREAGEAASAVTMSVEALCAPYRSARV